MNKYLQLRSKKLISLLFIGILFSSNLILIPTKSTHSYTQSYVFYDFFISWVFDINKNGSAFVNVDIKCVNQSFPSYNISIPKTAHSTAYNGTIENIAVFDSFWSIYYLEITPEKNGNITEISVSFFWPDFAVYFDDTYYVPGNEPAEICSIESRVFCNITLIFPEYSEIISGFDQDRMIKYSSDNRTLVNFSKDVLWLKGYLPSFLFTQPFVEERYQENIGNFTKLSYYDTLANWTHNTLNYVEEAYSEFNTFLNTRSSNNDLLTISFVPYQYIMKDRPLVQGFYKRSEDTIYLPSMYIFNLDAGGYLLSILFHEMAHAFTPDVHLPTVINEGIAEYLSLHFLRFFKMNEHAQKKINEGLKDPKQDENFNSTRFFQWNTGHYTGSWIFYLMYDLVNYTSPMVIPELFSILQKENVNFNDITNEKDRFEALIFYLNLAARNDTVAFFNEYGLYVQKRNLSLSYFLNVFLLLGVIGVFMIILKKRNFKFNSLFTEKYIGIVTILGILSIIRISYQLFNRYLMFSTNWILLNCGLTFFFLIGFVYLIKQNKI